MDNKNETSLVDVRLSTPCRKKGRANRLTYFSSPRCSILSCNKSSISIETYCDWWLKARCRRKKREHIYMHRVDSGLRRQRTAISFFFVLMTGGSKGESGEKKSILFFRRWICKKLFNWLRLSGMKGHEKKTKDNYFIGNSLSALVEIWSTRIVI